MTERIACYSPDVKPPLGLISARASQYVHERGPLERTSDVSARVHAPRLHVTRPTPWLNRVIVEVERVIANTCPVLDYVDGTRLIRPLLTLHIIREVHRGDPHKHADRRATSQARRLMNYADSVRVDTWVATSLRELRELPERDLWRVAGGRASFGGFAALGRALGRHLGLDAATRARLGVRMLAAIGDTPKARREAKRAKDRARAAETRRADGIVPRAAGDDVQAMMATTGQSRATCYRRLRRAAGETRETQNRATNSVGVTVGEGLRVSQAVSAEPSPHSQQVAAQQRKADRHPVGSRSVVSSADTGSNSVSTTPAPACSLSLASAESRCRQFEDSNARPIDETAGESIERSTGNAFAVMAPRTETDVRWAMEAQATPPASLAHTNSVAPIEVRALFRELFHLVEAMNKRRGANAETTARLRGRFVAFIQDAGDADTAWNALARSLNAKRREDVLSYARGILRCNPVFDDEFDWKPARMKELA